MPLLKAAGAGLAALAVSFTAALTLTSPAQASGNGPLAELLGRVGNRDNAPLIFGHRGASGYRPEHTLAAYELAIDLGADFIEPDLVSTSDGQLVARHENEIGGTTDVADHPEFASRKATKVLDGVSLTGWFTEDFTLAELKTLRARERIPAVRQENTLYNDRYEIPTLQEVIDLARRKSLEKRRIIGIAPETKHPSYFDALGLSLEEPLLRVLDRNGYRSERDAVVIQSFEVANLKWLSQRTRLRLVQLTSDSGRPYDFTLRGDPRTYADLVKPYGLAEIAKYADILGPSKTQILPRDASGTSVAPTTLVRDAHAAGLDVVPYTFRNENSFLPAELRNGTVASDYGRAFAEYETFFGLGVDGLFSDNTDTAVAARKAFVER